MEATPTKRQKWEENGSRREFKIHLNPFLSSPALAFECTAIELQSKEASTQIHQSTPAKSPESKASLDFGAQLFLPKQKRLINPPLAWPPHPIYLIRSLSGPRQTASLIVSSRSAHSHSAIPAKL